MTVSVFICIVPLVLLLPYHIWCLGAPCHVLVPVPATVLVLVCVPTFVSSLSIGALCMVEKKEKKQLEH